VKKNEKKILIKNSKVTGKRPFLRELTKNNVIVFQFCKKTLTKKRRDKCFDKQKKSVPHNNIHKTHNKVQKTHNKVQKTHNKVLKHTNRKHYQN